MVNLCKCCNLYYKRRKLTPRCGFHNDGTFDDANWNCFILNMVRMQIRDASEVRFNDCHIAMDYLDDVALVMRWYKERGTTTECKVASDDFSYCDEDLDIVTAYRYLFRTHRPNVYDYLDKMGFNGFDYSDWYMSYEDFMKRAESETLLPE